ncbi:glycosyltransferase [Nonomuraea sp. H19]|uniref:glycosyltransferase n=1 Tax=Nonomuraea sp. H19 TaxID=3452206 RepID=UPI003F8CD736
MRVAFVLGTTSGGTGRYVRMLTEGLVGRGHRVLVVGPRSVEEQFSFAGAGARFVEVAVSDRPHPVNDLRTVLAIRRLTRDADVVHAHGLRAGALVALGGRGKRLAAARGRMLVVTLHNALTAGGFVGLVYGVLERIVARRADRVLVVSPDLGARMEGLGARDVRAAVVPAPPLRPVKRTPQEIRDELAAGERPILLTIARLAQQKGLETLLDVAAGPWRGQDAAAGAARDSGAQARAAQGAAREGAAREGAAREGAAPDGVAWEGVARNGYGAAPDGAAGAGDGASPDSASPDSAARHGGSRDGVARDGVAGGAAGGGGVRGIAGDIGTVENALASGDAVAATDRAVTAGGATGAPLFVVAGEGPLRAELERRIAAEGLPVKLLGNRDDIPDLLGAATAVLAASRWEGQPLSIREALMAGKPVIATAVGGIPEIVGDAGILVPYRDVQGLRQAVRTLLEEPGAAGRLAAAAARRGREMPDGDAAVVSVLAGYAFQDQEDD